jgi:hypothetical protein
MSPLIKISPILAALLAAAGCPPLPEVIGETLTTPGGGDGDSVGDATTTGAGASTTVIEGSTAATLGDDLTGATTDPSGGAYGSYCELIDPPHPLLAPVVSPQPLCEGDLCALVKDAPLACFTDAECIEEKGVGSECDADDFCTETPAFLAENTRCTQACVTVADCPPIPGCMTGATCAPGTMLGPLCCQKMCFCNDHLDIPWVTSIQQTCADDPELCSNQAPNALSGRRSPRTP